jgi:hypothetical protein
MSETEFPQDTKTNAAEVQPAEKNVTDWLNWADLPAEKQGIIGLCFIGLFSLAGYFAFRQEPLACGMPSLVAEFNRRNAEFIKKENEPWLARGDAPKYVKADTRRIRALSNITRGWEGNFLLCTMQWDQGYPDLPDGQFEYKLGRDDKGNLTWFFYSPPPYLPVW